MTAPPNASRGAEKTFCRICEAHCGLQVERDAGGAIVRLRPDAQHTISAGFACAKGIRFLDVARHRDRLLHPLLREDGAFRSATWDEALDRFAARIRPLLERHGPHCVALYFGTPGIHNAMGALAYFAFARALGTRNLFSAGSQDNNSKIVAARLVHGNEWIQPIMDLERADFALLLGTNPLVSRGTYSQLPGGTTALDRFVQRGGKLAIVDPRRSESAQRWGGHVPIRPGTDIFLLLALIHELRDLFRPHRCVTGAERFLQLAAQYPAARAALLTDIPSEDIVALAASIRHARHATFFLSLGVNQGPFGTLSAVALQLLAHLSGNFDREGGLLFQPWAAVLGWLMHFRKSRSRIGNYLANAGGLPAGILADEILTEGPDRIRALIVFSGDPLTSAPDETRLRQAFRHLDLLVSIDLFHNPTGREAHLVLPATSWLERFDIGAWNAAFVQAPFIDSSPPLCAAPGQTRPEWRIFADLSIAAGKPLLGVLTRGLRRIPWDRILQPMLRVIALPFAWHMRGGMGMPWRVPRAGHYLRGRRRVHFWQPELDAECGRLAEFAKEPVTGDTSSFVLLGRRRLLAQNSWLHGGTRDGHAQEFAWLCEADMARLGLADGDRIVLRTAAGQIEIEVRPRAGVMPGTVVVPHGLPGVNVNRLIGSERTLIEPLSGMHRMTGIRVALARAADGNG